VPFHLKRVTKKAMV